MKKIKYLLAVLITITVAACGGGGGGGGGTPAPTTYSISGTVSGSVTSGVTINLSGASTASTTTGAGGTYTFSGLANGNYVVTPSSTGNVFTPSQLAVTVSGANVTGQNFTATANANPTYSISGSTGIAGASVSVGAAGSTVAGTGGAYTISGLLAGTYTVTPTLTGYTFSPVSASATITTANVTGVNFTPTLIPVPHSISGTVSGAPAGVTINVTGTASTSTTTGVGGAYTVSGLYDGTYTLTPSYTGYTFNPVSTSVTLSGANVTGTNFTGTANSAVMATVSGTVSGPWVSGVLITVSGGGASGTVTTNASGNYSFSLASGQTYTFTASLPGYAFTTGSATVAAGSSAAVTATGITETSAVASNSISGTLTYAGTQTGGITVRVFQSGCTVYGNCQVVAATHLPAQAGAFSNVPFTIRGLQFNGGSYVLKAGIGATGTGYPNASNPGGALTIAPTAGTDSTGNAITIADKTAPAAPAMPAFNVAPGDGGAILVYNPPLDANGAEIATSYLVQWGTSATGTGSGSHEFKAQGANQTVFLMGSATAKDLNGATASTALTNGTAYYFSITPKVGTTAGTAYVTPAAYTIGPVAGGNTVSGTVSYTGTATGPMFVAVHSSGGGGSFTAYGQVVASPTSGGGYSVAGVPAGTWYVTAILDQNNDGEIDAGDISNANTFGPGPATTVAGATTANLTLPTANAIVDIATDRQYDTVGLTTNYSVNQYLNDGNKHLVKVVMFSGPNIAVPADLGDGGGWGSFNNYDWIGTTQPAPGDTYQFQVTYSDGTSETLTGSVTALLGTGSLATGLSVANPTTATPTFNWTAPVTQPTGCAASVYVSSGWNYPNNGTGLACGTGAQTLNYNVNGQAPALVTGTAYSWQIQTRDANLNTATATGSFTN